MTVPQPRSFQRILGEIFDSFLSKVGVNDTNRASVVRSFFETIAQAIARANGDVMRGLRVYDIDRAVTDTLKKIAADEGVSIPPAKLATTTVTITDTSFSKISTKVYAGESAPNVGSAYVYVADAEDFPSSGSVYIGRNTPNVEGPLAYTSKTQVGSYWRLNLGVTTQKYHNLSESVILSQGGARVVDAGQLVRSPASGAAPNLNFSTSSTVIILDGEDTLPNVKVVAQDVGKDYNVGSGAIREFVGEPFTGAAVTNPASVTNGSDPATDDEIRVAIRRARASKGLGTATAVKNSILDASPSDENAVVATSQIVRTPTKTTLYLDDGSVYEEKSAGIGVESIIDAALGGEKIFQLAFGGSQTSVQKATLVSTEYDPYEIHPGDSLALIVGETVSEHTFSEGDFKNDGAATAFEVVSSVNSNSNLLFTAATANDGRSVTFRAISEESEFLQVTEVSTGDNAAVAMGLPSQEVRTLLLYKNRTELLNRNGRSATIDSEEQGDWSSSIQDGDTLVMDVDGTGDRTYTFTDDDFLAEGTHTRVARNNQLSAWVNVINSKVAGVTAEVNGTQLRIASNRGQSDDSSLSIGAASTLVSKNMFSLVKGLSAQGAASDFTLDRNTGQLELEKSLEEGESLSAGTERTRPEISNSPILGGAVSLSSQADLWFLVDDASAVPVQISAVGDATLTVTKPSSNVIRFTTDVTNGFANVLANDYAIVYSVDLDATLRGEFRVLEAGAEYVDFKVTAAEYTAAVTGSYQVDSGFVLIRCTETPQRASIAAGNYDINEVAEEMDSQLDHASVEVRNDEEIIVSSLTRGDGGAIMLAAQNDDSSPLNFTRGSASGTTSMFAFGESEDEYYAFPLFVHGAFTSEKSELPPASYISQVDLDQTITEDPNKQLVLAQPFTDVKEALSPGEAAPIHIMTGPVVDILPSDFFKRLRLTDRWYLADGYDFGESDLLVVVLDDDPTNETFPIPVQRRAVANTSHPSSPVSFNAYDEDSGSGVEFSQFFGDGFSFVNYKAFMKAKKVLEGGVDEDALLFRCARWGKSGEYYNIGYIYPGFPNLGIQHSVSVGETVDIRISLKSGPSLPSSHDGTTEFDVTITPNTPVAGVDMVTYTYNGTGTSPLLSLSGGEYVRIGSASEFDAANQGNFRISDEAGFLPTSTSFSVKRKNGDAVAESNKAVLVTNALEFFDKNDTTAEEIRAYVESNLSNWVTAEIVDKNGDTGAGILSLSTYEHSLFTYESVYLKDGVNWIKSNDFSGASPQFTFKKALDLATDTGYEFRDGEEVYLMPTTAMQLVDLISVLAVSGFTTLGDVDPAHRARLLEIASSVIGSSGAVQVAGGSANSVSSSITAQAILSGSLMKASIAESGSAGWHSGQWVKAGALHSQNKLTGFETGDRVAITPNSGQGTTNIKLLNRTMTSRWFGTPRKHVRTNGLQFQVERQGRFVCITTTGTNGALGWQRDVGLIHTVPTSTVTVTPSLTTNYADIQGDSGAFTMAQIGDVITLSGFSNAGNDGTFEILGISDDASTVRVSNADAVSESTTGITMSVRTEVGEGDTIVVGEPFDNLNQGTFRVIRAFKDSVYLENDNAVEEMVTVTDPDRSITIAVDSEFDISTSEGVGKLLWTGVGTEPDFSNIKQGDVLELRQPDVSAANEGEFMVKGVNPKTRETSRVTMPTGAVLSGGEYFRAYSPLDANQYEVWFEVVISGTPTGSAPGTPGYTQVKVTVDEGDSQEDIALLWKAAVEVLNGGSDFVVTVDPDDSGSVILESNGYVPASQVTNVSVPSPASVTRLYVGQRTSVLYWSVSTVTEAGVLFASGLDIVKVPAIKFSEYEAAVPGDSFEVDGDFLGEDNIGSYEITEVVGQDEIVVSGVMEDSAEVGVGTQNDEVFVVEGEPYVGYKRISFVAVNPGNPNVMNVMFDTVQQVSKVNSTGGVTISAVGKLGFPTTIRNGLDSYRYHTGLVAEANRIVYGEPRDEVTYPGVAAVGAEIFIEPPNPRRVTLSVAVRVSTGVAFPRIQESVRNAVFSVINASPIGESISFSSIISAINGIKGVRAISIDEPEYSSSSDLISVQPGEKAQVLDIVNDIAVLKVE